MKKNIIMIAVLSLSVASIAFASVEDPSKHLGQEKLSETSLGSIRCEVLNGLTAKGPESFGLSVSTLRSSGPKAGIAR